jgi:hypothetical protein
MPHGLLYPTDAAAPYMAGACTSVCYSNSSLLCGPRVVNTIYACNPAMLMWAQGGEPCSAALSPLLDTGAQAWTQGGSAECTAAKVRDGLLGLAPVGCH